MSSIPPDSFQHSPASGVWSPTLTGDDAKRVWTIVDSIEHGVSLAELDETDLANGAAGVAVFLAYLGRTGRQSAVDAAIRALSFAKQNRVIPELNESFTSGITGIAWTVAHTSRFHRELADDDLLHAVDELMLKHVSQKPWRGVFDHSHGLAGYGLYALERLDRDIARETLARTVDRLAETGLRVKDGVTWWTAPFNIPENLLTRYPMGYYNLGVAHGVPSMIVFLARVCQFHINEERARPLLEKAVRWLLAQRNPAGSRSCFARVLALDERPGQDKRSDVAWCYGDLGISTALYAAAQAAGEKEWCGQALEIALRVTRWPMHKSGVKDAGICHGAAGNAQMFNRLYQATRERAFLEATQRWLDKTLSFHRAGHGVGGFQTWADESEDGPWRDMAGIFGGGSGIGLVLLSAVCGIEPEWDTIMMISTPPAPVPLHDPQPLTSVER